MNRVVVAGHLCVDLAPRARALSLEPGLLTEVGPLDVSLGGSVANTGRALVALGHEVTLAARVGADDLGRIATEHLGRTGLLGAPTTTPGASTSYSIVLEPDGADRSFWHHVGANAMFDGTEASVDADVVHLGYPSLLPALCENDGAALRAFLSRARRTGAVTSVDLAVVDPSSPVDWRSVLATAMPLIDVITPSADDLRSALGDARATAPELVELLLGWGAGVVVVSDGARGLSLGAADADRLRASGDALACLADEWAHARVQQPANTLRKHVTTNGAGDAATAGVLSGILRGDSSAAAAARAVRVAAAVIEGDAPASASPHRPPEGTL
jgi:sugar/nucleoside kinase (ribokinase family)